MYFRPYCVVHAESRHHLAHVNGHILISGSTAQKEYNNIMQNPTCYIHAMFEAGLDMRQVQEFFYKIILPQTKKTLSRYYYSRTMLLPVYICAQRHVWCWRRSAIVYNSEYAGNTACGLFARGFIAWVTLSTRCLADG